MNTAIYIEKRTFEKYDENRYIVYLDEVVVPDYVMPSIDGTPQEPVTGYSYTGSEPDGGTLIEATSADRDSLINGIIRTRYSQTEEDAIKTHQIEILKGNMVEKTEEYEVEWNMFNEFRTNAIKTVDGWLS